jgi:hypothetical protein
LSISCVQYFGEWFGFFLLILWVYFEIYLQIYSRYLTIGIRALSLAKEGENFWLFLQIFSKEKRGRRTSGSDLKLFEHNFSKQIGYLNSSQKNTQFQKKNQPKWSSGSEVMNILNSTVFQGFSGKSRDFLL